jgi:hypothetical protein
MGLRRSGHTQQKNEQEREARLAHRERQAELQERKKAKELKRAELHQASPRV